jgi:hypothetical protein
MMASNLSLARDSQKATPVSNGLAALPPEKLFE